MHLGSHLYVQSFCSQTTKSIKRHKFLTTDSSFWRASNSGWKQKDKNPSLASGKCWSPLESEELSKHFTGCPVLVGWRPENQFLNAVRAWTESRVCCCCCSKSSFHWNQRKMLDMGPYISAKIARLFVTSLLCAFCDYRDEAQCQMHRTVPCQTFGLFSSTYEIKQ